MFSETAVDKMVKWLTIGLLLYGMVVVLVCGQSDVYAIEDDYNNTAIQYLNVGVLMASNLGGRIKILIIYLILCFNNQSAL